MPATSGWLITTDRLLSVSIPIAVLSELYQVDRVNPRDNPDGYQREPIVSRINSLKRELQAKRVDLPTAILLNLRTYDESRHIPYVGTVTELVLNGEDRLFIVDGQHRVESLIRLYEEDPKTWGQLRYTLRVLARS